MSAFLVVLVSACDYGEFTDLIDAQQGALATGCARERALVLFIALLAWVRTVSCAIWSLSAISGPLCPEDEPDDLALAIRQRLARAWQYLVPAEGTADEA